MDRPVMDPTYAKDVMASPKDSLLVRAWRVSKPVIRVLKIALRVLVWNPLTRKADGSFRNEDGTLWQRIAKGIGYRLAFLPVLVVMFVGMIVWLATHPRFAVASTDPNAKGMYFETIRFGAPNQPQGGAWLIPQVDAKKVIEDGEKSIRRKYPAVILMPECGEGADQVLPLIGPLHDAGFVVMAINLPSVSLLHSRGITFGLREASDIQSAVLALRSKPFVDPMKIAVVGFGGGANATLLAAQHDPSLRTLVIDRPYESSGALRDCIGPKANGLHWMQPLCKWAFELSYQVDAEELDLKNYTTLIDTRHVLQFEQRGALPVPVADRVTSVVEFLNTQLGNQ